MRVVGGKLGPDKKLGTYVSTVVPTGVADRAGIVEGKFTHLTLRDPSAIIGGKLNIYSVKYKTRQL